MIMRTLLTLSDADRRYLAHVSHLAFGNPFGETGRSVRKALSKEMSPGDDALCDRVHAHLHDRLERLKQKQDNLISAYAEQDRLLLHHAVLFDCLHNARKAFDTLIAEQLQKGGQVCKVAFGTNLLDLLTRSGMARSVALHYLAIYYQTRRARYFLKTTLIGHGASMERLRHDLWNSIFTYDFSIYERFLWDRVRELSTLFVGANGSGKKTAAAAVSYCSYIPYIEKSETFAESFVNCFIPVKVAQYSGLQLESALFGHKKMAYAEALENYQGAFSRCSPFGTIFLNNICEVPFPVQARLEEVVQEHLFTPVGDQIRQNFSGRLMASAPGKIASIRSEGRLRDTLYFSLGVNTISIPSLQHRLQEDPSDLELLIVHILRKYTGQSSAQLLGPVIERMHEHVGVGYAWPGNLLELEQIVKRILMVSHYESKN
ncbi:MAG: sigma 54-interacting transcriptional regulator [Desulfuromonadales bacterium]|nr:sigma 54-interacting transcriptional regulator [Desulfuromonadales bacterium]